MYKVECPPFQLADCPGSSQLDTDRPPTLRKTRLPTRPALIRTQIPALIEIPRGLLNIRGASSPAQRNISMLPLKFNKNPNILDPRMSSKTRSAVRRRVIKSPVSGSWEKKSTWAAGAPFQA